MVSEILTTFFLRSGMLQGRLLRQEGINPNRIVHEPYWQLLDVHRPFCLFMHVQFCCVFLKLAP